ncbi:translationally controlled tumor-associated [Terfezia boudieri ATCC MYA-4762]|uniref:Translationally-controlled tumor protein homolog n=1 Tax=Terfezia boudieri ATCC MYA-4762 TaxID=1051890 RepID=A0A3N4LE69_9PEZI|nr:translationally controlled tumor-associated [Terfezia boudieri ATCC MYA-4762]
MIIYKDVLSGDEMFSDAFPVKLVDDIVYEVDCAMIQQRKGVDVDIGANASAEGGDEELEDGVEIVNNVVASFQLSQTSFDKKGYLTYLKGYMKSIKAELSEKAPGEVTAFEKGASAFAKKIVANFKDYEFLTGASMNPDGMIALLNYREDGTTPYLTFWKHGLTEEKV